jgi:hypothetical protein
MASWKQRQLNERLLDFFMEKFALGPTWAKNDVCYANSERTALSLPDFCPDHCT